MKDKDKKTIERCFHFLGEYDYYTSPFCTNKRCDGYDTKCEYYLVWHKENKK